MMRQTKDKDKVIISDKKTKYNEERREEKETYLNLCLCSRPRRPSPNIVLGAMGWDWKLCLVQMASHKEQA